MSVTFAPTDTTDYATAFGSTSINVRKASPTFGSLTSNTIILGNASTTLSGTLRAPTAV